MNRRGFLASILAAGAAPVIVRAASLMLIKAPPVWVPPEDFMTIAKIDRIREMVRPFAVDRTAAALWAAVLLDEAQKQSSIRQYFEGDQWTAVQLKGLK